MKTITVAVTWIKAEFGGRSHLPFIGMRPIIRFQRYIDEWLSIASDVEIKELEIDETTWSGITKLQFSSRIPDNLNGLKEGELIELLDAYRVIAVGKIIEVKAIRRNL